jgi:site-specific recombinase XerD
MTRKTYKQIITSPEVWEQVEPKNKKLIGQFLKEKNTRSSDTTLKNYESDLQIFFTWNFLNNNNKFFIDIKKLEFSDFFSYATNELKWGSARFSRMRSVLSSLSNFIEKFMDEEYPNYRNLILKSIENMPKSTIREKTILKEQQINRVFEYLEKNQEYQISCWLALAIGSGSRFSEILRFTTDIIDINNLAFNDIFIETSKPIKTKGRTKQGKLLTKYIIKDIFW